MTEDRLTYLLTEATDLKPSADLRARAADLRPRPRVPWFALSGASAVLAVVAFLIVPRPVSAAELLRRADEAVRLNVAYRVETERWTDGRWQKVGTFVHEPKRFLSRFSDGSFTLWTSDALYLRFAPGGPILRTRAASRPPWARGLEDDPRPSAYARLLPLRASRGKATSPLLLTMGEPYQEDGHPVRDVVVHQEPGYRLRYTIDTDTGLPRHMDAEARSGETWGAKTRARYAYLAPEGGDEAFAAALRSAPIVDADALQRRWTERLSHVLRTVRSDDGKGLQIRDLRTLPSGDVLILYTGTPQPNVSLEGPNGEPFAPCPFRPSLSLLEDTAVPPLRPSGKPLCGLWFVPLHQNGPIQGPLRLRLWNLRRRLGGPNQAPRATADVRLNAPLQATPFPPYRDALAARAFDAAEDFYRTSARINALASRWLDAKGRPLPTPILPNPDAYPDLDEPYLVAPSVAARHDPQAAAEGARLLRGYLTRSHDTWVYLDRERAAPTLARLDAWAEGR